MDGDLDALDDMFGLTASTTTMDEFQSADVIMVVNAELTEDNLVAELKIKEAHEKGAAPDDGQLIGKSAEPDRRPLAGSPGAGPTRP